MLKRAGANASVFSAPIKREAIEAEIFIVVGMIVCLYRSRVVVLFFNLLFRRPFSLLFFFVRVWTLEKKCVHAR